MLRRALLVPAALALLAGCGTTPSTPREQPRVEQQSAPTTPAPEERARPRACEFDSARDLQEYLKRNIDAQRPGIMRKYNKLFGEHYVPKDIKITYTGWRPKMSQLPDFHYDFERRKLLLEFTPARDPDQYVQHLCAPGTYLWELYQNLSVGLAPHELGHWYHDQLLKKEGIKWGEDDKEDKPLYLGRSLVIEGTGTYLEQLVKGKEFFRGKQEYADPYRHVIAGELPAKWIYPAGERLVRPILKKSFLNGLQLMSRDPPRPIRVQDLVEYQRRILAQLE